MPSILIVDGNAHNLDAFPSMMKRLWFKDWTVGFAANRTEALQRLAERSWTIVCVDLLLPPAALASPRARAAEAMAGVDVAEKAYRNGIATVSAIRRAVRVREQAWLYPRPYPRPREVRIVAWSYYALPSHAEAARSAGACEVVDCRQDSGPLRAAILKWAKRVAHGIRDAA